jgi:hypothetical protein
MWYFQYHSLHIISANLKPTLDSAVLKLEGRDNGNLTENLLCDQGQGRAAQATIIRAILLVSPGLELYAVATLQ